jgi:hypothetical protein
MKIGPERAELFHADGRTETDSQTDMTKLIATFRNFSYASKKFPSTTPEPETFKLQTRQINP